MSMTVIALQIWLTFLLNLLKDVVIYFLGKEGKFRRFWRNLKRNYLIARTPFFVFRRHYKNFINEKNEIFDIVMGEYQNIQDSNPVFFFPALSQYWLLKRSLIQQYEKVLNIYLIDDNYDIFEDEIRQAKVVRNKDSLNKLIWKLQRIDPEFNESYKQSQKNLLFLKDMKGSVEPEGGSEIPDDLGNWSVEEGLKNLEQFITDQDAFLKKWRAGNNKIRNLEKFELYTDAKLTQKYIRLMGVQIRHDDSKNLLRLTKSLHDAWTSLFEKISEEDEAIKHQFMKSEKSYVKNYYKLLVRKYFKFESNRQFDELSASDAGLIISRSFDYLKERDQLMEKAKEASVEEKWKIAYRLWELNEIRKNICKAYLDIDSDFSKWVASYEKLTNLAGQSGLELDKKTYEGAEEFLKNPIIPAGIFNLDMNPVIIKEDKKEEEVQKEVETETTIEEQ
ncbi:hypothetical protein HF1_07230 [Mycoplasma haemofelis str. Langford 1]|uniref:Uncharacterized protein n=2 Tax=Mycoplasma haemofelis TaxID=29501 RepID=F6FIL7_MYCHI|nr:hypothetical protein [Mycoplasma haemofelis]AEG73065.1 hypothetical protein MHF_0801 [Mycoplasma haemofelis Ohio2]CBY92731.1 hypothetical protein HF1_07230 [Mycoplasma haemofelis str. Langford 1]